MEMSSSSGVEVSSLTPRQHRAIVALLDNVTVIGASRESGVAESTLRRWLTEPAFREEFRRQKRVMFERAVGLAQRAAANAVGVAINIMQNGENEFARLAAARVILDLARASEVEERLEAIEEQLSASDGEEPQTALRRVS